jgi:UDP-glucose 4-epimerase
VDVFSTDYPTPDGTCIRDYIYFCDLVRAYSDALAYLRSGGTSTTLNCGYGRGFSVLDVIETVKRVSGTDFEVGFSGRRPGDPAHIVAASDLARSTLKWQPYFDDMEDSFAGGLIARRWAASNSQFPTECDQRLFAICEVRSTLSAVHRGVSKARGRRRHDR